jgi:chromosome segregation protein
MRLQRLEISGFKSFCDRSELSFDRGVTGIVGPNGCGKSNVADAIVWVLGEQSAKSLRGDRMEDVIFSGSDARKPVAAAEVRLLLGGVPVIAPGAPGTPGDLVDDEGKPLLREVELTRRLYRSGESEYLINGDVVRLKDVHELLMDTGLGAKAYAIIEQGKIGMILSTRPTDRRQLIEEAAGVTKYKARRRAAELKLDAAQQNLTRIDDIIFEVEKQRGTLKRQAAKARRYQRLRDELRRWEKVLFARRQRVLAQAIETTDARIADVRTREAAAAGELATFEVDLERLRIELARHETAAREERERAHTHEVDIGRLEQRLQSDEQQFAALGRRVMEVAAEIEILSEQRGPAAEQVELRRQEAARAAVERDEATSALTAANEAHVRAQSLLEGLEGDVEAVRSEQYSMANAAAALQHAIDAALAGRQRVLADLSRLTAERDDLEVEAARIQAERERTDASLAAAIDTLDTLRHDRVTNESVLADQRTERDRLIAARRALEQDIAGKAARLRSLEDFESERAAYGDAARQVLAESDGRVRHAGSVADYLDVTPGFERAVEACLGELLQYVVVSSHEDASNGLAFVRERAAGRCGFAVVGGEAALATAQAPPVPGLTPLSAVVTTTGPYADVIRSLVTAGWIAESFDTAVAAASVTNVAVATRDGNVLRGPHAVAGGEGQNDHHGILQTRRDIRDLQEALAAGREELERTAERLAGVEDREAAAAAAISTCASAIHEQEKAIVGFEHRVGQSEEDTRRVMQKRELVGRDSFRCDEELTALETRQFEAKTSIAQLADRQRSVDDRLAEAQRRLFDAREDVRVRSDRVRDAMTVHARLVERSASMALDVARLEEAYHDIESRLASRRDEQQRIGTEQDRLRQSLADGRLALDTELVALEAARDVVHRADEAVNEVRQQGDTQEHAIRESRKALEAVRSALSEAEVQRAKAESDLGHLEAIVLETLQVDLLSVIAEVEQMERDGAVSPDWRAIYAEEPDEDSLAEGEAGPAETEPGTEAVPAEIAPVEAPPSDVRPLTPDDAIAELKRKIDRLGPVNMMAIEQYDELESRHGFLTTQRKDLVESISSTGEAIKRIDATTRERFREAFEAINTHFQQIFSALFNGGRAGLTLLDEQDLLDSGIEVIAQPPGKRLQSVQLLSGGEKALTAIALMFAIFRYKPSPFCVLDEIDAPLDDANTGRFLDILRSMQDETQFILITHNRKTMEIADRLYGVTMAEPGVSRLISVKLN